MASFAHQIFLAITCFSINSCAYHEPPVMFASFYSGDSRCSAVRETIVGLGLDISGASNTGDISPRIETLIFRSEHAIIRTDCFLDTGKLNVTFSLDTKKTHAKDFYSAASRVCDSLRNIGWTVDSLTGNTPAIGAAKCGNKQGISFNK